MELNTERLENAIIEGAVAEILETLDLRQKVREKLQEIIDAELRKEINGKVDALLRTRRRGPFLQCSAMESFQFNAGQLKISRN